MTELTREAWAVREKANRRADVLTQCESALKTVEDFIATARRDIVRAGTDRELAQLPAQVHHQLAWALANAASTLSLAQGAAISYLEAGGLP